MKAGSVAVMLALSPAFAQDDKVAQAIAEFHKACKGTEAEKAEALSLFKGLVDDKIFSEVARLAQEGPEVKKKLIAYLADIDHPRSAEILASMIHPNLKDKAIMEELQKAAGKVKWDTFYQPLAEALIVEKVFDKEQGSLSSGMVKIAEMTGSLVFVDQLIKVMKKLEDVMKNPKCSPTVKTYYDGVLKALKVCTGEEKADFKSYDAWWSGAKGNAEGKARLIFWCKATGKRWDKMANDAKTHCPHHEDRAAASRDPRIIAMKTLR